MYLIYKQNDYWKIVSSVLDDDDSWVRVKVYKHLDSCLQVLVAVVVWCRSSKVVIEWSGVENSAEFQIVP